MKELENTPKILVCAPSHNAADNIAERLMQIPTLQDKMIRYYPSKREDIFNLRLEDIKPYHVMHKILYMNSE
jgi:AAA domain